MQSLHATLRSLPPLLTTFTRCASKKAKGSSKNGRDSAGRRLGAKVHDGEYVQRGSILVRQRGTRMHAGEDVGCGRDHTLYALSDGLAKFVRGPPREGLRRRKTRVFLHVVPVPQARERSVEKWCRKYWYSKGCDKHGIPVGLHQPR